MSSIYKPARSSETRLTILRQFLLVIIFSLFAVSCSTAQDDELMKSSYDKKNERKISFYNEENGEEIYYEVVMKDGKIAGIRRNGQIVPENEIEEYEELVYDVLGDMYSGSYFHYPKMFTFKFDTSEFRKNMDLLRKHLDKQKWVFRFESDEFKKEMEGLGEELKDLDLPKPHIEFYFDHDKFRDEMDRMKDDLDEIVPPDLSDLKADMEQLKTKMKRLESEMEELDANLKKLDGFMEELKNELLKDGYIDSPDGEFEMELDKDSMKVNSHSVTGSDLDKYLSIYKKHFGKYPEEKIRIHTD